MPVTDDQVKVGGSATPVAPLAGAVSVGAAKFALVDAFHCVTKLNALTDPSPVAWS